MLGIVGTLSSSGNARNARSSGNARNAGHFQEQ